MSTRRRKRQDVPVQLRGLGDENHHSEELAKSMTFSLRDQPVWVGLAIASGMCAAINGVFAKLTTTSLTSDLSSSLSGLLGLDADNTIVNVGLRGSFFGLNLLFNAIMWALFTAALTKGDSTTRVSIVNVSANFFVTAILGWLIFSEKLPLLWWLGAALLACGNVVIGRREEAEKPGGTGGLDATGDEAVETHAMLPDGIDNEEADLIQLGEAEAPQDKNGQKNATRVKKWEDIDDPI